MHGVVSRLQGLQLSEQRRLDVTNLLIAHAFQTDFVAVVVYMVVIVSMVVTLVRVAFVVMRVVGIVSMVVALVVMRVVVIVSMVVTLVRVAFVVMHVVVIVVARIAWDAHYGRLPIVEANIQLTQLTFESRKLNGQRGITSAHARFNFFFNAHQ